MQSPPDLQPHPPPFASPCMHDRHSTAACDASQSSESADYAFWDQQKPIEHGTKYVRHVTLSDPLEIVVDGQSRHGVVMRPGKSFGVYVEQVAPFMQQREEMYSPGAA